MKKKTALWIIFWISLIGILFSGYLSYSELFLNICASEKLGMGACSNVMQIPACVCGLVMYIIIFVISSICLKSKE